MAAQQKCVLHIYTPRQTSVPNFMRIGSKNWGSSSRRKNCSPPFVAMNMPLPWQHTFYHCQKMCLAHLHPKANICAKFHENWWKTEEVVRDARFFPHFCHNYAVTMCNTLSTTVKKCVLHIYTPRQTSVPNFMRIGRKTEEASSCDCKIFPPVFAIICRYHGNTLSVTVEKCVLHIYTPRQTSLPNFMTDMVKNWGSQFATQDWRLDRPPDRRHAEFLYYPPYTLRVCGGIIIMTYMSQVSSKPWIIVPCLELAGQPSHSLCPVRT